MNLQLIAYDFVQQKSYHHPPPGDNKEVLIKFAE